MTNILVFPWTCELLKDWDIIGMNHYYFKGEKCLFVVMTKDGQTIKADGSNDSNVFLSLQQQALKIDKL